MTEEALKPCPFCGEKAKTDHNEGKSCFLTSCGSCGARTTIFGDEATAASRWNRRAGTSSPPPQWRPMAEAPERDGINVLVSWWGETLIAWKHGAYWYTADAYGKSDMITPEAWMPLPDPLPYPSRTVSD